MVPRQMTLRPIVDFPARILRLHGTEVTQFDKSLGYLVDDMFETMYEAKGVGLAAPQIGMSIRLFVMDCDGLKLVAINPHIVSQDGEQDGEEGCLSIGRVPAEVKRPLRAVVRAHDLKGKVFQKAATGYAARCLMHETDHCNGVLFIDHLTPLRRAIVTRRFRKLKKI
jgi:peptide deformylase